MERRGIFRGGTEAVEPLPADFAMHCTMQAERDVYECATKAAGVQGELSALPSKDGGKPGDAEEPGDNVEFFLGTRHSPVSGQGVLK